MEIDRLNYIDYFTEEYEMIRELNELFLEIRLEIAREKKEEEEKCLILTK